MKKITFIVLRISCLCFGSVATAQEPMAQSDLITGDGQQIIQADSSSTGSFEAVAVDPSANSDVSLQFPQSVAGKMVSVQALDGGVLQIPNPAIAQDGNLSFSFQASDQPGVHRVVVIDPSADDDSPHVVAIVQFEVPSPAE
jgi:hypothetical protein